MADLALHQQGFIACTEGAVGEQYELLEKIAEGDNSIVLKGRHRVTGQMVAVKVLAKVKMRNLRQMEEEVQVMKVTDHPHVARLYSVYSDANTVSLILELYEGPNLFDFLLSKGSLCESDASVIFKQILSTLFHLHSKNICHRDIKPENYLFAISNDLHSLKLIDFGFSKLTSRPGEVMRTRVGSPFYSSPEVFKGTYGLECDMWSAGVILYVLLSGSPPFTGKTLSAVISQVRKGAYSYAAYEWSRVSPQAKDLIDQLLITDPSQRLTAEQALRHPWLHSSAPTVPLALDLSVLRQYQAASSLRRAVLFCIARQCTEREVETLRTQFEQLDTNGDGVVSMEEFRTGVASLDSQQMDEVWNSLDADRNGKIDYTEFLAAMMDKSLYLQREKLWEAFTEFDRDGTGKITAYELMRVLGDGGTGRGREYWNEMIRQVDTNGDGVIDFAEFMHLMDDRNEAEIEEQRKRRGL